MIAPSKFYVSDHCLLRYLQRVKRLDIEGLRGELKQKCAAAALAGAKQLVENGIEYKFKQNRDVVTLATIIAEDPSSPAKIPPPRPHQYNDHRPHKHKMRLAKAGRFK